MDNGNDRLGCRPSTCVSRFLTCFLGLGFSLHNFAIAFVPSPCATRRKPTSVDWAVRSKLYHEQDYAEELPKFIPEYTGITKHIEWKLDQKPIPIRAELDMMKSGVLWRRGEFCSIPKNSDRYYEIERKCKQLGMTLIQGLLLRKQILVTTAMKNTWKLNKQYNQIERKFLSQRKTLLQLSKDLNLPPVNIIRAIVRMRVQNAYPDMGARDQKVIVKNIINESDPEMVDEFLSDWEVHQLQIAKDFDYIGYQGDQPTEVKASILEQAIYSFLDEQGIDFLTEDDMRAANSSITPDVLLLDDCIINGRPVRWIDAKNYYGCGLREKNVMVKDTKKQIAKYEGVFGASGAIVFRRGFSRKLLQSCPSTLFLDAGPLQLE